MKNYASIVFIFFLFCFFLSCSTQKTLSISKSKIEAPRPMKQRKVLTEFGKERFDDYYWLNNPEDSAVIAHLNNENDYSAKMLANTEGVQKELLDELSQREDPDAVTTPVKVHDYWYYLKFFKDSEFPIYYRKKESWDAPEEEVINVANFAINYKHFNFNQYTISPNGRYLAFTFDTTGDLRHAMYFKDLETGKILDEHVSDVSSGYITWSNDNQYVYYLRYDKTIRSSKLLRHKFGTDFLSDEVILEENDVTFDIYLSKTRSRQYIMINCESTNSSETWYLDINKNDSKPQLFAKRQPEIRYEVNHFGGDEFYVKHNFKAPNLRISKIKIKDAGSSNWQNVIPHLSTALILNYEVINNYVVIQDKMQGTNRIRVVNPETNTTDYLRFDDDTFVADLQLGDVTNTATDSFRVIYSSLKTPPSVYKYSIGDKSLKLLSQNSIKNYKPRDYESNKIYINARDGESVPLSMVYKKSKMKQNGKNPLLLIGYGAYGMNTEAHFRSEFISLMDRGFVIALAHIRGGSEMGGDWYKNGRLLNKKNTFHDYIDCADYLIAEKYTSKEKVFGNAASAGGSMLAATINERPDLFKGVIAEVPWVDVVTDMQNEDLPLVTLEYAEWGNPSVKAEYDYMLSWSPYDQVKKHKYPSILATGSLFDSQVRYYNPAKWVLKLRDYTTSDNPILFKCDLNSGHFGSAGRYEKYKLTALKYAFLLNCLEK
jgi:oligopeptidase B